MNMEGMEASDDWRTKGHSCGALAQVQSTQNAKDRVRLWKQEQLNDVKLSQSEAFLLMALHWATVRGLNPSEPLQISQNHARSRRSTVDDPRRAYCSLECRVFVQGEIDTLAEPEEMRSTTSRGCFEHVQARPNAHEGALRSTVDLFVAQADSKKTEDLAYY